MPQITVMLALASPTLHAKLRSELLFDPGLELVFDASSPAEAVTMARLHQPQVVVCDRGMLADGQMAAIAQQARVVSLLVLATMSDDSTATRVAVPVAGVLPFNRRIGDLRDRLQAIIEAPASFIDPALRHKPLRPPSQRLSLEPWPYEVARIPSLPRSGRLTWLSDAQPAAEGPMPVSATELSKNSFLRSAFDASEMLAGPERR